jgi:ankyrin repeat protein
LLYLCHTTLHRGAGAGAAGLVAIARRLLMLGADPHARFPWLHHGVRRAALWGAICVTRQLPLAEMLLENGADPNDGVTLPIAAGGGDLAALELLHAYGANVNQPWATDGASPLYSICHWADTPVGIRWLLEHGADPDPVFEKNGETPLHVVAQRWDPPMAALLAERGADITRRRADGRTPYALAELNGNRAVADWLLEHGASRDLSEVDRLVAACSRGDRVAAQAILTARPELREQIQAEHYVALHRAAERGDADALETMLACGFDPNRGDDSIGKTALHAAAMEGWPDAARVLLAHGASVTVRDREFKAQPLIWAAEGSRMPRADRDHAAVGRLLLEAGSPVDWQQGDEPSEGIIEIVNAWRGLQ